MKPVKPFVSFLIAVCISIASPFSALAAGFNAEELYDSVFIIYSGNYYGSGFAIGENCIITNAHVINGNSPVRVKTYAGDILNASIAVFDEDKDIAVLYVQNAGLEYLTVADPDSVRAGNDIYTIGAPNDLEYTLTKGIISAVGRQLGSHEYYQIDAVIDSGSSGSPLVSETGEVIGINTMKATDSPGIGFAIPMTTVCMCLENAGIELTGNGNVKGRIENMTAVLPEDEAGEEKPEQDARHSEPAIKADQSERANRAERSETIWVWAIISGIAILLVTCLLIVRKTKRKILDPKERTDFNIDFLE